MSVVGSGVDRADQAGKDVAEVGRGEVFDFDDQPTEMRGHRRLGGVLVPISDMGEDLEVLGNGVLDGTVSYGDDVEDLLEWDE